MISDEIKCMEYENPLFPVIKNMLIMDKHLTFSIEKPEET